MRHRCTVREVEGQEKRLRHKERESDREKKKISFANHHYKSNKMCFAVMWIQIRILNADADPSRGIK